ncbi:MAG: M28 family peptidase [Solirubrobacteraceae bacterium]
MPVRPDTLRSVVERLAQIERPSASEGEREAAEWIAAALRERGCEARVEAERAHGTYWWPLGIPAAAAVAGGFAARRGGGAGRLLGAVLGAAGAWAVWDDIGSGAFRWRRRLPSRTTWNVVAEAGDRGAERTLVIVAHHDAAHSGLLFHPGVLPMIARVAPALLERSETSPPLMAPVLAGPALVAAGATLGRAGLLRAGALLGLGSIAVFADVGARGVVPGANDNLTGVAVLVGLAEALREEPVSGLRVLLVSTGSEESFMEGMDAFARRHLDAMPRASTTVLCVDTVGSPQLVMIEGEGMLVMRDYPEEVRDMVAEAARDAGVPLRRGLRLRNATDGVIALRRGFPCASIGSVNRFKAPANYHWPTDTPPNVHYETVGHAAALAEALVRRMAATG